MIIMKAHGVETQVETVVLALENKHLLQKRSDETSLVKESPSVDLYPSYR